jgi:L-xylulokinase
MTQSGVSPEAVAAIGCSGHGNGLYALDARGEVLPRAYQSLDTRADAIVREWDSAGYGSALFEDAWQRPWPGQPLALLGWLRRHEPDTFDGIATVLLCKDFINHRLTGRAVSDFSDMSAAGLLMNAGLAYNDPLFDRLGFEALASRLPDLVVSTDVIGVLSDAAAAELGLMAGTPVAGGLFDVAASAIGSGGAAAGSMSLVAGTWSIATVVTREPLIDRSLLMTTAFADATRWMAIEASATSAANLNWFTSEAFVDEDPQAADGTVFDRCCDAAASAGLKVSGPIYHPFLYGSPTDARARAGFYGISASHGRADLARAVLEGVAFGHRRHVSNLVAAGATPGRVRLTGGGARSGFWSQMFADVLGMPIEIPDAEETGARGAALAAGVAIKAYRDLDEAMDRGTRVARAYTPDPEHAAIYDRRFEMYTQLVDAMGPFWRRLGTAVEDPTA